MLQRIMDLAAAMDGGDWDEELMRSMCQTAMARLERRLKGGVTPEECGEAFPVAAAWMALGGLYVCGDAQAAESFSAGDLTIRTGTRQRGHTLEEQARRLMAPYCEEDTFAVQGVKG